MNWNVIEENQSNNDKHYIYLTNNDNIKKIN